MTLVGRVLLWALFRFSKRASRRRAFRQGFLAGRNAAQRAESDACNKVASESEPNNELLFLGRLEDPPGELERGFVALGKATANVSDPNTDYIVKGS